MPFIPIISIGFDQATLERFNRNLLALEAALQNAVAEIHSDAIVRDSRGTEYNLFRLLDEGVPPHEIRPTKPGGVLVFEIDGEIVFARRVQHPGIAPRHYLLKAVAGLKLWIRGQGQRVAHLVSTKAFSARDFLREGAEDVVRALRDLTPGRLKTSYRIEVR